MAASALLLTLAGAVVHAAWNLLLSRQPDTYTATAVAVVCGTVLWAPVAALSWRLPAAAIPYALASAALEGLYLALLAAAYAAAATSFVYPLARGSAPVLVLLVSAAAGTAVSWTAAGGVLLVTAGVVLVRGIAALGGGRELALALGVGACIAGYTLIDKHGVAHAAPFAYLELVFVLTAPGYAIAVRRARGGRALRAALRPSVVLAGVGVFAAYGLVLAALRLAPPAPVAAVRESSVVILTAWLAISGRERVNAQRFAGALLVAAGVALVALG